MTAMLSEAEAGAMTAARVVYARGSACPGPLLEVRKSMATVAMGEILEVWSSDPQTKADVAAWAAKVGHEFLGAAAAQGYDRVFIRRGIKPGWILYALQQGFDGVFLAADGEECGFLPDCAARSARIAGDAQALMASHGIDGRRLKMAAICSVCAEPFARHVREFTASLGSL